jgi:hypothetical protein
MHLRVLTPPGLPFGLQLIDHFMIRFPQAAAPTGNFPWKWAI